MSMESVAPFLVGALAGAALGYLKQNPDRRVRRLAIVADVLAIAGVALLALTGRAPMAIAVGLVVGGLVVNTIAMSRGAEPPRPTQPAEPREPDPPATS
jgi:uncharacterized membrane protein